jgi:ZIP family zinc transporter
MAATAATDLGALPALALRQVPARAEGVMLGFAAGVMLAASAFSLIVPSIDAGATLFGGRMPAALLAAVAIGVAFSGEDPTAGIPIATAIAIRDVPEGLVVALAHRTIGYAAGKAVLIGAATGLTPALYPFGLALAAGAMLCVVSHEIIPETHRKGHQLPATMGVMGGFAMMMVLDNAFI